MNILLILISLLLFSICIIGILATMENRRKKRIQRFLRKVTFQFIKENSLSMYEIDFFESKAIGIDKKNNKLVFIDIRKGYNNQYCIDLEILNFCSIVTIKEKTSNQIEEVFIEVRNKRINEIAKLTFYESVSDNLFARDSLIRRAEYWKNNINFHKESIKFNPPNEYVL